MRTRTWTSAIFGGLVAFLIAGAALAQPANDECASAIDLFVATPVTGSNVGATPSAALMSLNSADCTQTTFNTATHLDVFYRFVAPATAAYTINTCGSTMPDTVLTLNSDCPITQAGLLACNDDSTSSVGAISCATTNPGASALNSRIASIVLTAGQTYYIGVAGYDSEVGAFNLVINYVSTVGSCCDTSSCILSDSANCSATYADGGTCTPNPCAGACCHASNSRCSLVAQSDCPAGDTFLGTTVSCSPSPCTTTAAGVCCRGATCNTTLSAANCTGNGLAGAIHTASGSSCNAAAVFTTPCCYSDYNKTNGVGVPDIFDFLNDWFAGSPFANFAGDGSPATLAVQNIFDFLNAWFAGGC